jgi:hypothetical protein
MDRLPCTECALFAVGFGMLVLLLDGSHQRPAAATTKYLPTSTTTTCVSDYAGNC